MKNLLRGWMVGWFLLFAVMGWSEEPKPVKVTVTFSILADLVGQVGGEGVVVKSLVGAESDAHVYQPTPTDAAALSVSQLLVVNGLGFEGWMERLIKASGYKGPTVVASQGIQVIHGTHNHEGRHSHKDHAGEAVDPHAWHHVPNVQHYVMQISRGLANAFPTRAEEFRQNADRYNRELAELEQWIQQEIGEIPVAKRKVVTSHDAFGYFAQGYGITFLSPVGLSTDASPSASGMVALIRQMKKEQVSTVFVENMSDPRLVQQLARESGAKMGGQLYADALSKAGGPASTYVELMRHNVRLLKQAMRGE
ncbi:MAG: zinc ABC transporter solute-binding protein [Magnetococcales bacterium]|nr:zinc ABC transporter solute-binding protein [Magnetococcales bacterium]